MATQWPPGLSELDSRKATSCIMSGLERMVRNCKEGKLTLYIVEAERESMDAASRILERYDVVSW